MLALSEHALICDMAETYHVYNWRTLPLRTAATLACGLRDDSRIKMLMAGTQYPMDTYLLASIADMLKIIAWQRTKDGQKGVNKPKMILDTITRKSKGKDQAVGYKTAKEYEAARAKIVEEIKNGRH